jgi:hypothetical protein
MAWAKGKGYWTRKEMKEHYNHTRPWREKTAIEDQDKEQDNADHD